MIVYFQNTSLAFVSENKYENARSGVQSIGHGMEKPVQCPGVQGREVEVDTHLCGLGKHRGGQRKSETPQARVRGDSPCLLKPGFLLILAPSLYCLHPIEDQVLASLLTPLTVPLQPHGHYRGPDLHRLPSQEWT